jgi:hypothetical protein
VALLSAGFDGGNGTNDRNMSKDTP